MGLLLGSSGLKDGVTTGQRELAADQLLKTRHSFNITFYVRAFDLGEPEDSILQTSGLPLLRALHNNAYCVRKVAREISASALLWEVDAEFDSHVDVTQTDPAFPTYNVRWSWSSESTEEVLQEDPVTGKAIVNAVGEPLIITAPIVIPVLTIERIQPSFSPNVILNYKNRTNTTPFWGAPRYTALMSEITDDPEEENGITVRRVRYVIKFNFKYSQSKGEIIGWRAHLLNHGTKHYKDGKLELFLDRFKNPTTGNLDEFGTALHPGFPPLIPPAPPVFLTFHRFREANLNDLSLGPF